MKSFTTYKMIFYICLLTLISCKRPEQKSASVTLQIPSVSQSMSASDYSLLCFVANVKSLQIPAVAATTCDVEKGLVAGSVAAGGVLSLDVPVGEANTFEIYGLMRKSLSESCPTDLQASWKWPLTKVYFLGKATAVNIVPPESQVTVSISLPSQNIVSQNSWPQSCSLVGGLPSSPTLGRVQMAAGVLSGTNYKIYSRASNRNEIKTLSGSLYQIHNFKVQAF